MKRWWILGAIIILILIAAVVFFMVRGKRMTQNQMTSDKGDNAAVTAGKGLSGGICEGTGPSQLSAAPMKDQDFSMVIPYGSVVGDHVTPIDHQYFAPTDYQSPRDAYEVFAMADGHITSIGRREKTPGDTEYRLTFTQTCTFLYYYDLVTSLAPDLKAAYDESSGGNYYTQNKFNFPVKAGQLIGHIGGRTLDFAVLDTEKSLKGFVIPESYKAESWKIYTADPLDYYTPELKTLILAKYIRTVEPLSGKIDHDIDGRLIGNWFVENTNGYGGASNGRGGEKDFMTHLAFVPDHIDPTGMVVSIGDYGGQAGQFAIKGTTLRPADVSPSSGLIKYELTGIHYVTSGGGSWNRMSLAKGIRVQTNGPVHGTVLAQMISDRQLKFEAFPEKTAAQVSDFTLNARLYTR